MKLIDDIYNGRQKTKREREPKKMGKLLSKLFANKQMRILMRKFTFFKFNQKEILYAFQILVFHHSKQMNLQHMLYSMLFLKTNCVKTIHYGHTAFFTEIDRYRHEAMSGLVPTKFAFGWQETLNWFKIK